MADIQPIRLVICDDHSVVRSGLVALLAIESDFEVIGEASTIAQSMHLLRNATADIALIDIAFPDGNGIEIIEYLHHSRSPTKPLVLSSFGEDLHVLRALQAGARGYLLKSAGRAELMEAIRTVTRGGRWTGAAVPRPTAFDLPEHLSTQESRILRLLATGASNEAIGRDLGISVLTAKTHVHRILQKLHARSRSEAVAVARRWLLVP